MPVRIGDGLAEVGRVTGRAHRTYVLYVLRLSWCVPKNVTNFRKCTDRRRLILFKKHQIGRWRSMAATATGMYMGSRIYSDYFGIPENAFSITPDPRFLFMSERHCEALAHLLYGVVESGCFILLTGEVGTGKTTVCRALLEKLPENVDVALLLNPPQSGQELLLAINDELNVFVNHRDGSIHELVYLLTRRLLENHSQGRRTVVIIDEAQNIAPEVLEQVRLLTNLETRTEKLLHVFIVGQPELRELLMKPSMLQVAQRITARYHLEPLSGEETRDYIYHRLSVAGCRQRLFSEGALRTIHRESRGVPRVINILCDRALLGVFASDSPHVTPKLIRHAARQWRGEQRPRYFWQKNRLMASLAAAGLLGTAAMVSAFVDELSNSTLTQAVRGAQVHISALTNISEHPHQEARMPDITQSPAAAHSPDTPYTPEALTPVTTQSPDTSQTPRSSTDALDGLKVALSETSTQSEPVNKVDSEATDASSVMPLAPHGIRAIGPGSPPYAVRWLRRELDRIDGTVSTENGPLFDKQLRARVMALQRSHGLVADGIAGPHTLYYMHVIYGTSVPFNVGSSRPGS